MVGALVRLAVPMYHLWVKGSSHRSPTGAGLKKLSEDDEESVSRFAIDYLERGVLQTTKKGELTEESQWISNLLVETCRERSGLVRYNKKQLIDLFVRTKFNFIENQQHPLLVSSAGTPETGYTIAVHPDAKDCLQWAVTRELFFRVKDVDPSFLHTMCAIVSLVTSLFVALALPCSALPALGIVLIIDLALYTGLFRNSSIKADVSASKFFGGNSDQTIKERSESLQKGITFLKLQKARRAQQSYWTQFRMWVLYPSEDSRIAGIQKIINILLKCSQSKKP